MYAYENRKKKNFMKKCMYMYTHVYEHRNVYMHVNVHDHVCVCTCTKKIICMYAYFFEKIYTPWRGGGYTSRTSILAAPELVDTLLLLTGV